MPAADPLGFPPLAAFLDPGPSSEDGGADRFAIGLAKKAAYLLP